jgi:hypothetical protein
MEARIQELTSENEKLKAQQVVSVLASSYRIFTASRVTSKADLIAHTKSFSVAFHLSCLSPPQCTSAGPKLLLEWLW